MKAFFTSSSFLLATVIVALSVHAEDAAQPVVVNAENFIQAETAMQFGRSLKTIEQMLEVKEGTNQLAHLRGPTPRDKQAVIRMNRDTIDSAAIVDIGKGATLTVPDGGDRYLSVKIANEDHYINKVIHEPGEHQLTV